MIVIVGMWVGMALILIVGAILLAEIFGGKTMLLAFGAVLVVAAFAIYYHENIHSLWFFAIFDNMLEWAGQGLPSCAEEGVKGWCKR